MRVRPKRKRYDGGVGEACDKHDRLNPFLTALITGDSAISSRAEPGVEPLALAGESDEPGGDPAGLGTAAAVAATRAALAAADTLAALLAAATLHLLAGGPATTSLLVLPLLLGCTLCSGLYGSEIRRAWHRTSDELARLVGAVLIAVAAAGGIAGAQGHHLRITGWAAAAVVGAGAIVAGRFAARLAVGSLLPRQRTLLIAADDARAALERKTLLERGTAIEVVGSLREFRPSPTSAAALYDAVIARRIAHVIIAGRTIDGRVVDAVADVCRASGRQLSVAPMMPLPAFATRLYHVGEQPLLGVSLGAPSAVQRFAKRAIDLALAGAAALVGVPLMLVIAAAVRLDSKGPVLFRQQRVGKDGAPFTMFKFRTMVADAEARLSEVVGIGAKKQPAFKMKEDPRVTRVGRLLRGSSLDELAQILNVLAGDMSLVGVRPEEVTVVELYSPEQRRVRLAMKPGLTGPMQVHGRSELTTTERLLVERDYVDGYSLRKDLAILARTPSAILFRHGAF